jgi:hypothetical protein
MAVVKFVLKELILFREGVRFNRIKTSELGVKANGAN